VQCHEARGIFAAWGVKAEYLEKGQTAPIPITCPVCHDPHDPTNERQLRFPISAPNVETNLCMKCHQRRSEPDSLAQTSSPHSPQGPLLLGDGGWEPPNFIYAGEKIVASHGTEANPRLCAGCHVSRFEVTDPTSGNLVFNATGHLFKAIPCLDATGKPTGSETCALSERTFQSCTAAGCHGSEDAARSAYIVARDRIQTLVDALNELLDQVPSSETNPNDNRLSVAEGAQFNASLGGQRGSKIHNPFRIEALLTASIQIVTSTYGLQAPAGVSLENAMGVAR
jgi:predicted CXXCH cytochrome family protein